MNRFKAWKQPLASAWENDLLFRESDSTLGPCYSGAICRHSLGLVFFLPRAVVAAEAPVPTTRRDYAVHGITAGIGMAAVVFCMPQNHVFEQAEKTRKRCGYRDRFKRIVLRLLAAHRAARFHMICLVFGCSIRPTMSQESPAWIPSMNNSVRH